MVLLPDPDMYVGAGDGAELTVDIPNSGIEPLRALEQMQTFIPEKLPFIDI